MSDKAIHDRDHRLNIEWFAAQSAEYVRSLADGAWVSNDVNLYSRAWAELRRRIMGGTWEQNYRHGWNQV